MRLRRIHLIVALFSCATLTALGVSSCSPAPQKPQPLQIVNPVMPGDFPDPSVIRVGDEYWATATSSEWAPQYPLLRSKDLLNWELVGSVFQTPPEWSEANYWAPEIATDNGRFFIYYVARKKGGPLCVAVATADKPQGPYTDHGPLVCQDAGSIDGVLIRDENGKLHMLWKEDGNSRALPTPIWAQELSEDGTQLIGTRHQLILNDVPWEGGVVEGPFVIKRNEWFYMFYAGGACCGRECTYGVGVARSRKLLSGWEKHPLNPIVKANADWKCPGHGSVVTDPEGRDYLLYHAYSTKDTVYVGRQGILDQITWGEDGWPSINRRRGVGGQLLAKPPAVSEEFNGSGLVAGWQWPNARRPQTSVADGMLTLGPAADRAGDLLGGVVARSTNAGNYTAVAVVDVSGLPTGAMAGLSAFGDPENALGIGLLDGQRAVVWRRKGNKHEALAIFDSLPGSGKVQLRMVAREGHLFRFMVRRDGQSWTEVGPEVDGSFLPPWDRGVRVALTVGGVTGASARFDSLTITPD